VVHILWECPSAMDVRSLRPRSLQKSGSMGISLTKVFEDVLLRCTFANINSWAVLTRKVWLRRNFVVFGGFHSIKPVSTRIVGFT
jgi:REP element-mobilizing transposase RayT